MFDDESFGSLCCWGWIFFSSSCRAVFTKAWIAVGPVTNSKAKMIISLMVTNVMPECTASPVSMSNAPKLSIKLEACTRVMKSGILRIPKAPIRHSTLPLMRSAILRYSRLRVSNAINYASLFSAELSAEFLVRCRTACSDGLTESSIGPSCPPRLPYR